MSKNVAFLDNVRKKVTQTHELICTTYHESGHTIYALLHYMIVWTVRVYKDKESNRIDGFTNYCSLDINTINDPFILSDRLRTEVGLCYAGLVAEKYQYKLHSGSDKFPSCLSDGSSKDIKDASGIIKKFDLSPAGKKRYNYKQRMIKEVNDELKENWDAVTVVAHALFKKKRLNFDELKMLLTTKTESKEFWKDQFAIINNFYSHPPLDKKEFRFIISR